jgi:Resolvase, N terminal domain
LAEPDPDFVIAGPDLLPGLPATPAPLFVFDSANAIDEASIAAITITIALRIGVSSMFSVRRSVSSLHLIRQRGAPGSRS